MIKQSQYKIISCFAVCGIDPELIQLKSQICTSHDSIILEQKYITGLEFVKQKGICNQRQKEIEIANNLFLKITYNENNRPKIVQLEFFILDIHDSIVKMISNEWLPVPIRGNEKFHKDPHSYRQKQINIGAFLYEKKKVQKALVLCYRTQLHEETIDAISDIEILQSERKEVSRKSIEQKQIFNLPLGFKIINHSLTTKSKSKYLIFKRIKSKLESMYKAKLLQFFPQNLSNSNISLNPLPFFCFPDGVAFSEEEKGFYTFSFILTLESAQRIYGSCLIFKQQADLMLIKSLGINKKVYCEKAICILSQYSYPQQFTKLLFQLYRISVSPNDIPFYKVIENLDRLTLVEKQNWGKIALNYSYGGCNILFHTNKNYPIVSEKSIFCLFKFLQFSKIICLFQAMLLQKRIFLISRNKSVLGLVVQAILSLLFPFKWEQVLIPILPINLREYIQAPVPFIIGLTQIFPEIQFEKQIIIVNFDQNQIFNEEGLPPLPNKMLNQLEKRLSAYKKLYNGQHVKQYLYNSENPFIFQMETHMQEDTKFDAYDIRDAFYEFNLTLMKNYTKYWVKNSQLSKQPNKMNSIMETTVPQTNYIFNTPSFLNDLGMSKIGSFGFKFSETSMFIAFIETRISELDIKKQTYFQECLQKRKNKKQERFIVQNKGESYRKVPAPSWEIKNGITYTYKTFPSILHDNQQKIKVNKQEIEEEMSTAVAQCTQQIQKQKNINMIYQLSEKSDIYKGFINQKNKMTVYPKQLHDLQIGEFLKELIWTFITKEQMILFTYKIKIKIKQYCRDFEKFPALKIESIVLNCLNEEVLAFQKQIASILQDLRPQLKFKNMKKQLLLQTFGERSDHKYEENSIVGYHHFYEFHTIRFENKLIVFYENNSMKSKGFKKVFVKIQNKLLKHIINTILINHLAALTLYLIEKAQQNQQIALRFNDIIQFKNWLLLN